MSRAVEWVSCARPLLSFRPSNASGEILRVSAPVTSSFAVFGTNNRSRQDPSTDARDDKDGFFSEILRLASLAQDDKRGCGPPLPSAAPPPSTSGKGKEQRHAALMSAPVRYVARGRDKLSIAPITLEKGKITLLPFSLYSEELHEER